MNNQIILKQEKEFTEIFMVNDIFYTIQGEGPFAGTPAVFIRLMGCNLQCPRCDTEYSDGREMKVSEILKKVYRKLPSNGIKHPLVVITGGEPFRQNIYLLVQSLLENQFKVQIETNGTLFVPLEWMFIHRNLTIVCSPKTGKIHSKLWPHIKSLKYVVNADSIDSEDGLPNLVLDHSASPKVARWPSKWKGEIFVQPVDVQDENENKRHQAAALESAMQHGYTLCLQMHKIVGVA